MAGHEAGEGTLELVVIDSKVVASDRRTPRSRPARNAISRIAGSEVISPEPKSNRPPLSAASAALTGAPCRGTGQGGKPRRGRPS
ncbi:MAG TPA: hypothetical protein VNK73_15560 [Actinomycetota bacterium]|nr:hypothetical protein [Actinomycetota bacterium]